MIPRLFLLACLATFVVPLATTTRIVAQQSSPAPSATCPEPNRVAQTINAVEPDYPDAVAKLHLKEKTATVGVKTDAAGAVIAAWIELSSGNEDLDKAALAAVRQSTFRPALANCVPVASEFGVSEVFEPLNSDSVLVTRTPAAAAVPSPSFSAPRGWVAYTDSTSAGWQMFSSWRSGRSSIWVQGGASVETIDQFHEEAERDLMSRGASIVRDRAVLICNQTQTGWLFVYTMRGGTIGYAEVGAVTPDALYIVVYGSYDQVQPNQEVMASLTSLCIP